MYDIKYFHVCLEIRNSHEEIMVISLLSYNYLAVAAAYCSYTYIIV